METVTTANPLRAGLQAERTPAPNVLVIFGASGDLTRRKLIPALYNLARERLLPAGFAVVGYARRPYTTEEFRQLMRAAVDRFSRSRPVQEAVWESFADRLYYLSGQYDRPEDLQTLAEFLGLLDRRHGTAGNRLYYLATPPDAYPVVIHQIGQAGLGGDRSNDAWTRIIVEKPFGRDLETARALNRILAGVFDERQIYRIDHYLGKETVQNILVFRFANGIFEPLWNRQYVDHVQITVSESIGIEGRGAYYDQAGALRDMVQNHMLQLLALVAMEPPVAFDADAVRDEKVKVLRAIRPIGPDEVDQYTVRGQYGPGTVGGLDVPGYLEEPLVNAPATTETYVALKLYIDNWRWAGTPFYLRTGKRLPKRVTEIAIQFRRPPHVLFAQAAADLEPNVLVLRIQPGEGISLKFGAKVPGPAARIRSVNMDFLYDASFGSEAPEAYERLLLDCMLGDSTLFTRRDEVETAWALMTPILEGWARRPGPLPVYPAGTWGPAAAEEFIAREGRRWRRP